MANADKSVGEDMEQEAAQELRYRDRQGTFLVAMGGVSPAKGDVVLVDRDQAVVGNGDASGQPAIAASHGMPIGDWRRRLRAATNRAQRPLPELGYDVPCGEY